MQYASLALLIGFLVAADDAKKKETKTDKERIQGTWTAVSFEIEGKKPPEEQVKNITITFKGDDFTTTTPDGQEGKKGTFKLDSTKKLKELDFIQRIASGSSLKGIYTLDGDTLRICFGAPGADNRPTEFMSKDGSGTTLVVLKRAKP